MGITQRYIDTVRQILVERGIDPTPEQLRHEVAVQTLLYWLHEEAAAMPAETRAAMKNLHISALVRLGWLPPVQ